MVLNQICLQKNYPSKGGQVWWLKRVTIEHQRLFSKKTTCQLNCNTFDKTLNLPMYLILIGPLPIILGKTHPGPRSYVFQLMTENYTIKLNIVIFDF
jgi:hypothetical protein